jgi:O-antigen/teichoic acid export membrane protein
MRSRAASPAVGGVVSRIAPSAVQLVLIVIVAHRGATDDVGRLVLASALAFLCGNLAELGTMTSLSLPQTYFGERFPPLRATRKLRFVAAVAGSACYGLLWAAGIGSHETVFLAGLALPALLALSYGYAGALNATGALATEGLVSIVEAFLTLGITFVLIPVMSVVAACLIALTIARAAGTVARAAFVRRRPQSSRRHIPGALRSQLWFLSSSAATVIEGQADIVVLGFLSTFALLGVYGPLLRAAYALFLIAEGISLAMYSTTDGSLRRWRSGTVAIGVMAAIIFALVAKPLLDLVLPATVPHLLWPVLLLALLIPVRFAGYAMSVDIVRAGRQAARIPVLVGATLILVAGAIVGWQTGSLSWLAGFRLASEVAITLGFVYLGRRFLSPLPAAS